MLARVRTAMRGGHAMLSTNFVDGAPVWVDLGAPEVARAAEFYGSVFGWRFESSGPEAGGYGMFTHDGKVVAAAGPPPEPGAAPPRAPYFTTSAAPPAARAGGEAGGAARLAPADGASR